MAKSMKFKVIETDNLDLKAFDAKVLLIIANHTKNQKELELEALKQKISQVDQQLFDKKNTTEQLDALEIEKENEDQEVPEIEKQVPETKKQVGVVPNIMPLLTPVEDYWPDRENECPTPTNRRARSSFGRAPSAFGRGTPCNSRSLAIRICSDIGFDMTANHVIHQVFSEAGKIVDIIRSDDNREVMIVYDSAASASSAVKHLNSIEDMKVRVYHA